MPKIRKSKRRTIVKTPYGYQRKVCEGHGEWRQVNGFCRVPMSNRLVLYTGLGSAIDEEIGVMIRLKKPLPSTIPDDAFDSDGDVDTTLTGRYYANSGSRTIYYGGDRVPDLTLLPPDDDMNIGKNSFVVTHPMKLSSIFRKFRGVVIHWAACTIIR